MPDQMQQPGQQQPDPKQELMDRAKSIIDMLKSTEEDENDFWKLFEDARTNARYDCTIDDIQATPTYKLAILETLTRLLSQGVQIPQRILVEYLDIEESVRDEWRQELQSQAQAAQAAQQQQMQTQVGIEQMKNQVKIVVQELINKGLVNLELVKQQGASQEQQGAQEEEPTGF